MTSEGRDLLCLWHSPAGVLSCEPLNPGEGLNMAGRRGRMDGVETYLSRPRDVKGHEGIRREPG